MSVQPDIALSSAQSQMIDRERAYTDWRVMLEREAQRSDRIDAVIIATPPQLHFPIAKAFLERGIDVICEKPMTRDLAEAQESWFAHLLFATTVIASFASRIRLFRIPNDASGAP